MFYKDINWKSKYDSYEDNVLEEFYKPAIIHSKSYKRITGYFTPSFLENLAKEIKSAKNLNNLYIQILCSPHMPEKEVSSIELGYKMRQKINSNIMKTINKFSEDNDTLPLISDLIAKNILDIKFVITKNRQGIFHAKEGVFTDTNDNKIAFGGSNNETHSGVFHNYESFFVFNGWEQEDYIIDIEDKFDELWKNNKKGLDVYDVSDRIYSEIENKFNYSKISKKKNLKYPIVEITNIYDLYDYQNEAIKMWVDNNYTGLFEMATGTGKTVTALAALEKLSKELESLLTVIVVPQNELIYQWEEDIIKAGGKAIKCFSNNRNWENDLRTRTRYIEHKNKGFLNILVTRDTFMTDRFINIIERTKTDKILVSDEVHSFGSATVRTTFDKLNSIFKYKLGVSATPFRRKKSETKRLVNFFDKVVFSYSLKEAIKGGYLNHYNYDPKIMFFDEASRKEFRAAFHKERELILNNDLAAVNRIEKVTSTIMNSSKAKVDLLQKDLKDVDNNFQGIVYCSPGTYNDSIKKFDERHIDHVSNELGKLENVKLRKIRSQVKPEERQVILDQYKNKDLNTLLAIKCLDQGINLKGVTHAYILSSTDSETEFIQRRGRILRIQEGKPQSKIIDYVMLPQDYSDSYIEIDESDIYIIQRELRRMKSYMNGADNEKEVLRLVEEIEDVYKEYLEEIEYEFSE